MDRIKKAERKVERLQVITELSKRDVNRLVVLRPLTERQKEFFRAWDGKKSMEQIAQELGVSRPMVYKLIDTLSDGRVVAV